MKYFYITFLSFFLSFSQTKNNFVLKGKCTGLSNQYLYLNYDNKTDSCYIIKDEFIFKGEITNYLTNARFDLKNKFSVMSRNFYLETTEFDMDCSEKIINDYSVLYLDAKNFKGGVVNQLVIDLENISNLNKNIPNRKDKLFFKIDSIVKNYPKNDFSGDLLSILTWDETLDKEKLKIIYKKLNNKYQRESSIKTIENNLYPEKYIKIGDNVFNFKLPNQYGITFDTAELKGKYYLIDFWASWCGPCRKLFPDLIAIYEKFRNKNFDILTVSIDEDLEKWKQAILKDKINWYNVIESKKYNGKIVKKYNVSYLPKNFLINPEGTIIAIEITLEDLEQFLSVNLKE